MKNVAAEFVRAKPNRACPPRRVFRLVDCPNDDDGSIAFSHLLPSTYHVTSFPDALLPLRSTVFELAKQLPQYGVGSRFTRARWEHRGAPDSYWTVMRMKPKASGRAGRAWGQLTWKGEAKEGVRRIPGTMKAGIWRVLEESKTISGPKLSKPEPSGDDASLG